MRAIIERGDTPAFQLVPVSPKIGMTLVPRGLKRGVTPIATYRVSRLGPSGLFEATGLLPVSGHAPREYGTAWTFAENTKFQISIRHRRHRHPPRAVPERPNDHPGVERHLISLLIG